MTLEELKAIAQEYIPTAYYWEIEAYTLTPDEYRYHERKSSRTRSAKGFHFDIERDEHIETLFIPTDTPARTVKGILCTLISKWEIDRQKIAMARLIQVIESVQ